MGRKEDPRLIARVARLYYESRVRQNEIAEQLGLSQAAVSRLLTLGEKEGIVKIVVNIPRGVIPRWRKTWSQSTG
jgi:DNA-binding transcriptional regulator LsrR (DeoR family)